MAKYQIETTNGTFEIETEDGQPSTQPQEQPSALNQALSSAKEAYRMSPAGMAASVMDYAQQGSDAAGEYAATELAKKGVNPQLAAGVGTVAQMAPDIVSSMLPGETAVKSLPRAAEAASTNIKGKLTNVLQMLKSGSKQEAETEMRRLIDTFNLEKPAQSKVSELAKRGTESLDEAVLSGRQKLQEIPEQFREKATTLEQLKKATSKEFGQVEDEMGIGFKSGSEFEEFVGSKKKMGKFLEKAQRLAGKGSDKIAKEVNPSTIQLYRKIAQEGKGSLSDMGRAQLEGYRETFAKSLEQVSDKFKNVRGRLAEVNQAIDELPKGEKAAKEAARRQIIRAQSDLKKHNKEMSELMAEAKKADKQQLNDIKRRALVKVRQAAQKERLIKTLKYSLLAAGGLTYLKGKL